MKRFLLYIVCAIVVVSCGLSIYYVVRNDEKIYTTSAESERIYLNIDEIIRIPVEHDKANSETKLTLDVSNESVLDLNLSDWTIKALNPGETSVKITSSNANFGPFEFAFVVGNGSEAYPFYIRNEEDFKQIGEEKFALSAHFELVKDINLTEDFEMIGSFNSYFSGSLSGGYKRHSINNLKITTESTKTAGLFAGLSSFAKVENLVFNNPVISANAEYAGVIAGVNNGLIGKVEINNAVVNNTATKGMTGLIAGKNESKHQQARISLCSANGTIESNYIAGGITGTNRGAIITNNNITVNKLILNSIDQYASFGGVAGFTRDSAIVDGDISNIASVVMNNMIFVDKIESLIEKIGGAFGGVYASSFANRGLYSMLVYNLPTIYPAVSYDFITEESGDLDIYNDHHLYSWENAKNHASHITKAESTKSETFLPNGSTWDLKNIWKIDIGKDISLNYASDEFEYQVLPIATSVVEIDSNSSLKSAVNQMISSPMSATTYLIKGEYSSSTDEFGIVTEKGVYTFNGKDLAQIGTKEQPFMGRIISEDGAFIKFTNFASNGVYSGLFGYVAGVGTQIENVIIQSANIEGTMVGGITGYNSRATISNCKVVVSNLTTTKYAGGIAGFNNGLIEDCIVEKTNILIEEETELNIYLGGIVGKSKGSLNGNVSNVNSVNVGFEGQNNIVMTGGIAGAIQEGESNSSSTSVFNVTGYEFAGRMYAGGVVGYLKDGKIEYSGVLEDNEKASCLFDLNLEKRSYAGGIAGYVDPTSQVLTSSIGAGVFKANTMGGLVAHNDGEIDQCYVGEKVVLEGTLAGGLASSNKGVITNSYTYANLCAEEFQSGFVNFIYEDSLVENCMTYCNFSQNAKGKSFADTVSNYKARPNLFGKIKDSAIITQNDFQIKKGLTDFYLTHVLSRGSAVKAEVQVIYYFVEELSGTLDEVPVVGGIDFIKNYLNTFEEKSLFGTTQFENFTAIGFHDKIWNTKTGEVGNSLTLKNTFDSGYKSIEETQEKTEETNDENSTDEKGEESSTVEEVA